MFSIPCAWFVITLFRLIWHQTEFRFPEPEKQSALLDRLFSGGLFEERVGDCCYKALGNRYTNLSAVQEILIKSEYYENSQSRE